MSEEIVEKKDEFNWHEIRQFIENTLPHAEPFIVKMIENKAKEQDRHLEIARLQHITARTQLRFEIMFIVLTILFAGAIIWVFIDKGAPDTAEKILFAVLGFIGGRGFIKITPNN